MRVGQLRVGQLRVGQLIGTTHRFSRDVAMETIRSRSERWDVIVIGGGATGVAIAMDAASRGLDCLLVEQSDFGSGTSSRSTKLVHGGVRYLRQGNITLVRDALHERTLLLNHAPHLVHDLSFLIPCKNRWERFFYGTGLRVYDFLSTRNSFGRSRRLRSDEARQIAPTVRSDCLRGGVVYHDGQFDDTRLLINMARTASDHGACLVNYVGVTGLMKDDRGRVSGVSLMDRESQTSFVAAGSCVVNATGPFCDSIRRFDDQACEPLVAASQGVHLVLPREFFPGDVALMVPKTDDGRVLFMIPWHDHVVVGTTDTPIEKATMEPVAQAGEVQFLLDTLAKYLTKPPTRADVLSVFTGIRPLVRGDKSARTASLARDHVIKRSPSGMLTITGGKWTTARKMGEDCVDRVVEIVGKPVRPCQTPSMMIHGASPPTTLDDLANEPRRYYGTDLAGIRQIESANPSLATRLHPSLEIRGSDVQWAVTMEMARTVEDVLARRTRSLFLDSRASVAIAPQVARQMCELLGRDRDWSEQQISEFTETATKYSA